MPHAGDMPEPRAGPGQVRIRVQAAGLDPYDGRRRSGALASFMPLDLLAIPGLDATGSTRSATA